jgi:hypothetical protein
MSNEPWFRRFGLIGYYPIRREGFITVLTMGLLAVLAFGAAMVFEKHRMVATALNIAAVIVVIGGHAVVFNRMERN